jgi:hypothetical protein
MGSGGSRARRKLFRRLRIYWPCFRSSCGVFVRTSFRGNSYYIEIRLQRSRKPSRVAMDILDHDDHLSRLWDSDNILYA